jgi:hypothetical protein
VKNLIEVVAEAIYAEDPTLTPFHALIQDTKEYYYNKAQAAVEAYPRVEPCPGRSQAAADAINSWLGDIAIIHP